MTLVLTGGHGHSESEEYESRLSARLVLAIVALAFLLAALALLWQGLGGPVEHFLAGVALLLVAVPVAYDAVRRFRSNPFNTDLLMLTAAVGAAAIGVYEEGAAVLILYHFAETLEDYTVDKVRNITRRMASLLPQRALVKRGDKVEEIPVEEIEVGDIVVVKPGWRIPVDGRVVAGSSTIDQSTVTGESIPVEKQPGDVVLSGTLNLTGSLELVAEKPFRDSTVSRITKLVIEAREKKIRLERFIDRFSRYYTPATIVLAALVAIVPPLMFAQPLTTWVYRALIVLVIACPSAIVIATPVTVMMGLTRAMWSSSLVKGGVYMEKMARIRVVAFDKTGTLTKGVLRVVGVKPIGGFSERELLKLSALAASRSTHPIANAIVEAAKSSGISLHGDVKAEERPGMGVSALTTDGQLIMIGRHAFVNSQANHSHVVHEELRGSVVDVAVNNRFAGTISLSDTPRPEAREAVQKLKRMGIRVVMLTGDDERAAREVAEHLGIDEYYAGLLPEDKVRVVRELRQRYGPVMMVGDGVNDAAVLAAADVGVAVGTAGNDIAIEAADVALMGNDLRIVEYLIRLSKRLVKTLKANLMLAIGLKLSLITLGVAGLIPLWAGVLGDDGVTLAIIALALPLLRFR